ncbi:hypothetical protein JHW43_005546 [Diplocarpon mali]|nr:hypothetical protein JHW43_005546 [Diplocarpon mali]
MLIQESRQDVGVVCDPLSFGDIRRGQKEDACGEEEGRGELTMATGEAKPKHSKAQQSKTRQGKARQGKARRGKAKQSTININTNTRYIR